MALIDGLGGSKRWNRWLSVVDRVALSAWNTHHLLQNYETLLEIYGNLEFSMIGSNHST